MLFRTNKGELIEINKYDFTNDKLYYGKILEISKPLPKFNLFSKIKNIESIKLNNKFKKNS
jgi:hypothetical protein